MKTYKLLTQGGAWYTWVDESSGEEIKFLAKDFENLLERRTDVKEQMYKQICDAYILGYKDAEKNANIDSTELDEG